MEEKKDKIITILVIIVLVLTGVLGYLCFSKTSDKEKPIENVEKKKDTKNNNILASELLSLGYIKKEESTSKHLIEINDGKVRVLDLDSNKKIDVDGISGTPKVVSSISASANDITYVVLTEDGDLYTSDVEWIDNGDEAPPMMRVNSFIKVNTKKVLNIYTLSDKSVKCLYPEKDASFSVFVEYDDGSLMAYTQSTDTKTAKVSSKFTKSFNEMFPTLTSTCK